MLTVNRDSFISSFPIWMSFISSSCLIAVARAGNIMLNKKGKSGQPCLVPDLKGNTCSFCPLSMMLAVGLSYMAFTMFRYVHFMPTLLRVLIINGCWILSNAFSASIDMTMSFLSFILFTWWITFIDLWLLYQPHIPRINPTWSWCVIFLMYCSIWFAYLCIL